MEVIFRLRRYFSFIALLLIFIACEGGINNITVGIDGSTTINPSVDKVAAPVTPTPAINPTTSSTPPNNDKPTIKEVQGSPNLPQPTQSGSISGSILDGLPALTKNIFLNQRESAGMPSINGEKISADVYGDILIIRYTKTLTRVKYSNDIKSISTLGEVEDQNARVEYPTKFVKLYFQTSEGDVESKIFGVIESE